jgi:membrane protease YdiL (CAAX protease family)
MQQLGFDAPVGWELIFVFITLVVLPSLVEEIVFRGILFRGLKKYIGVVSALIGSSLIFGMAHLEFFSGGSLNYIAALDTTILAVVLTALYIRAGSLWPAILLHAIKNSIAFVVLFVI